MNQELTKEMAKKLMEIKGEARGITLKVDMEFVLKEKGQEGLKKLEEELEKLGYPIKYKEINIGAFYPIGLDVINILAIKKLFGFDEKKLKEMGMTVPKFSFFIKLILKYFFSIKRVLKEISKTWRDHYTVGDLKVIEVNEEKKYLILRLENFDIHPVCCPTIEGYFMTTCQMVVKGQTTCTETKCTFRGDEYHEFLIKW